MAYDGKLLARARGELEKIRERNRAEQERRQTALYASIPALQRTDEALRLQMIQLAKLVISRREDISEEIERLRTENKLMQERRRILMSSAGYAPDYLDNIYSCPLCRDTGIYNNGVCSCLDRLYKAEVTKELSTLLKGSDESFERFELRYYSTSPDPVTHIVPRECMRGVLAACRDYAENFSRSSDNILFQGGTGLGKTFLSACIARTVSENGFSVCYESCSAALEAFELQRFSRDPDTAESAAARARRMLDCDLLILDDLGTEMLTSVTMSALYTLINSRLNASLPMLISTNCTDDELQRRYSPQIYSRISGSFLHLPFAGRDIRILKKEG